MKKKIIGISCNIVNTKDNDSFPGFTVQRIFTEYVEAVKLAGGIPILIPATTDRDIIKEQVDLIDGLIITGGYDIDPDRYGEEPHPLLSIISNERDEFEFTLLEMATKAKIPYLGICRGHQLLNVANGGTLYQDLSEFDSCNINHVQKGDPHKGYHKINITEDSNLFNVFGKEYRVNSFHHQGIKKVADGFKITAKSLDGTIEAIEKIDENTFLLGVQWHPEIMAASDSKTLDLFKYFISKC